MTISEVKRQVSLRTWAERIQARQASGQNVKAWCIENNLRENQYYYWLKEIRKETVCPGLWKLY